MTPTLSTLSLAMALIVAAPVFAAEAPMGKVRLTTDFRGENLCLDVC